MLQYPISFQIFISRKFDDLINGSRKLNVSSYYYFFESIVQLIKSTKLQNKSSTIYANKNLIKVPVYFID